MMKQSPLQYYHASKTVRGRRSKQIGHALRHPENFDPEEQLQHGTRTRLVPWDLNKCCPQSQKLILPRHPSCSETQLSTYLATLLTGYDWDHFWIGLVPVRVGHYRSVDLAVMALLESHNYTNTQKLRAKAASIRYYLEAMTSLQETMSSQSFWTSEEAQVTVGVLSAYEAPEGSSLQERLAHKRGLLPLFARNTRATEVVRAMAFDDMYFAYLIACAQGVPSPFDSIFWLVMEPTPRQTPTKAVATLFKLTYRLQIRLPGLMVLVRDLSTKASPPLAVRRAIALADELLTWKSDSAESELLHSVGVTQSQRSDDAYIVPVGLKFESLSEFRAGIFYWKARITLNRLCARLQRLSPSLELFDLEALKLENFRMATNLLMGWKSTFERLAFGTAHAGTESMSFALAVVAVWGVLTDVDEFHGHSSDKVRESVVEWYRLLESLGVENVTAQQMDELADLFAGGPVQGLLPSLVLGHSSKAPQYPPFVDEGM